MTDRKVTFAHSQPASQPIRFKPVAAVSIVGDTATGDVLAILRHIRINNLLLRA